MQLLIASAPALLAVALFLGGVLAWSVVRRRSAPKPLPRVWALAPRPAFNSDERRFYRHLREAVPHLVVLAKLPLVRFCQPTNPQEVRFWYELLGASNVTFAVCSANGRVLLAVDLVSDRSPSRRSLQIKHSVLAACKVRYLRCAPDQLPAVADLQAMLPSPTVTSRMPSASSPVAESRERLANTVASRRLERATQWQDSRSALDSRFGSVFDSRYGAPVDSRFGAVDSRYGSVFTPSAALAEGAVVVDGPPPPQLRH